MSWILFFIAVGFALWYRKMYIEAEKSVHFWITSATEWKEKFNQLVVDVMKSK